MARNCQLSQVKPKLNKNQKKNNNNYFNILKIILKIIDLFINCIILINLNKK
jgi:hypothetical protein